MTAVLDLIPGGGWLKFLFGPVGRYLLICFGLLLVIAEIDHRGYARGKADTLEASRIEAGKRILTMEKHDETFRRLPARDRCLAFMRDSGLPDIACDER